jgi:DNA recombination protein RmuC
MTELFIGLGIGAILGVLAMWIVLHQRLSSERAAQAGLESTTAGLREQLAGRDHELNELRIDHTKERERRATADARLVEAEKNLGEQKRLLSEAESRLIDTFRSLSSSVLKSNSESFLQLARQSLEQVVTQAEGDLGKRQEAIKGLVQPLEDALKRQADAVQQLELHRKEEYGKLKSELASMTQRADELNRTTSNLATVLGNSRARGQWGQKIAEDILRSCGLREGTHYKREQSIDSDADTGRPDYTFLLPENNVLFMDVKFPGDNYYKYLQAEHPDDQRRLLEQFIKDVRQHLRTMEERNYQGKDPHSLDYMLIFIANEQVYGAVNERIPGLIDECLKKKFVLCGPMNLYAFVRVLWHAWQNFTYALAIQDIVKAINAFEQDYTKFKERFADLGKKMRDAAEKYQEIETISYKRLDAKIRRIDEYRKGQGIPEALPEPDAPAPQSPMTFEQLTGGPS